MSLKRISIAGYKSIERVDVELARLNVLIGANGAGKSNFVGIFELLREIVEGRLQAHVARQGGADALLRFGQKHTPALELGFDFDPNGYRLRLAPSNDGGLFIEDEVCSFRGGGYERPYEVSIGTGGARESRLSVAARRRPAADYVLRSVASWRVYHFHDTTAAARIKQHGEVGDMDALRSDASNLAAFLFRLEKTAQDSFALITRMVQRVAPFFERFRLRPDPINEDKIRLEWVEKGSDTYFNAHALSDGTLRFICLATVLLQPDMPSVVLLDEPELGLHPLAITLLAELLRRASNDTQLIVSTQSVTLVDNLEPRDLLVVERRPPARASVFRRMDPDDVQQWIEDYSLGELWQKNVLGGRPS